MEMDEIQYKIIVESSPNMIWRAGTDALCNYFNNTWLAFTGRTMEQEMGNGWAEGVHPDDFERCLNIYLTSFEMRKPFEMEYRLKRFDGVWRWINDRGVPYYHEDNEFGGYIGSCVDVTEKVEGELLREIAYTDYLTGIYNRYYFEKLANIELDKAKRYKHDMCIVMMDINKFKHVNDTYGHAVGNKVLKTFAGIIQRNIRSSDIACRYGGDEFVILMPNTHYEDAHILIKRIAEDAKSEQINIDGDSITITFSFGISALDKYCNLENLYEEADKRMYDMKQGIGHDK